METMREFFRQLFLSDEFMPHAFCFLRKPALVWLHATSDILIGLAYLSISLTLYALVRRIRVPFSPMILAFGVFIGACGLTHFMEVVTLWIPDYWLAGGVKAVTAVASVATGVWLFPVKPRVVELAGSAALAETRRREIEQKNAELETLTQQIQERAREDQRTSEARFRSLVLATSQIVWTGDPEGRMDQPSPTWLAFTGQTDEEYLGMGWLNAVHPEDRQVPVTAWADAVRRKGLYECMYRLRKRDGGYATIQARGTPLLNADGSIREWIGASMDITERVQAEQALRESEARFRATFEQAAVGLAHVALDGRWLLLNQRLCDIVGYTKEELLQQTFQEITWPADLEADLAEMQDLLAGKRNTYSMEKRYVRKDGSPVWAQLTASVVRDGAGAPRYFIAAVQDISERKQVEAERDRLLEETREAVQVRDEFLSVAAHELKTPLTSLKLQIELLTRKINALDGELAKELIPRVEVTQRQVGRLAALNKSLLDVSRIDTGHLGLELQQVDLEKLIRESAERMELDFMRAGCEMTLELEPGVMGRWDPLRLDEAVVNLLGNAAKYGAGKPVVVTLHHEGEHAILLVRDQGIGIRSDALDRIFRKFERAAPTEHYGGLGLGLYITRRIVEAMGGTISVTSEPGEGTTFRVALPLRGPPQGDAESA